MSTVNKQNKEIAETLTNEVFKNLKRDIAKGTIQFPEDNSTSILPVLMKSSVTETDRNESKLYEIVKKKKMLEQELERLKLDQQIAKQKRVHPLKESAEGKTKYFRSQISEEQKSNIKRIIKVTQIFQEELEKRNKDLQDKIKKTTQQERIQRQRISLQKKQISYKRTLQNLSSLQTKKKERSKSIKQANKQFERVSKLKFLHETIQQKWKLQKKAEVEQTQRYLQKHREEKLFKIEQIKQHARRYSDIVGNYKQKKQKQDAEFRQSLVIQNRLAKHTSSAFFKKLTIDEEEQKRIHQAKMCQEKQKNQKRQNYAQTVRYKHKQTFKKVSPNHKTEPIQSHIRSSRSLNNMELQKLGNDYMKQIHQCIGDVTVLSPPLIKKPIKAKQKNEIDYLTKARLLRQSKKGDGELQSVEMRKLKAIMENKEQANDKRLKKATQIVQKLDQKAEKGSKHMINSIMAKLSVIEEFSNGK